VNNMTRQINAIIINEDECCPICKQKIKTMPIGPGGPHCVHGNWRTGQFSKIVDGIDGKKLHYCYRR